MWKWNAYEDTLQDGEIRNYSWCIYYDTDEDILLTLKSQVSAELICSLLNGSEALTFKRD